MQSVGEKLRRGRLEKNLSLEDIYKQTKIHSRVLEALEQDRAHNFLSLLYVKGFLKSYAQYLGLDAEALLKEYMDSQNPEAQSVQMAVKKKQRTFFKFSLLLALRIALGLVLAVALVLYFRFVLKHMAGSSTKQIRKPKIRVTVIPDSQPKKTEDLIIEIRTKFACWLRVKTDNRVIFEQTLSKGRNERWRAKEKIELRIGKPEALEVLVNGEPIDLKAAGVKRTLIITRKRIEGK